MGKKNAPQRGALEDFWEVELAVFLQSLSVMQDISNNRIGWLKLDIIQFSLCGYEFIVLTLQFAVAQQSLVNCLGLLWRGFEVKAPHQILLGKNFCHRHYYS